ncbi:MAG: helix-turn-helix domain-containing protein [Planctomycetes bacterium]|nr:helix-turn-helix domain-containing protein [Planctomycetota bacterium]
MQKYDIPDLSSEEGHRLFHYFRWPKGIRCPRCNVLQNKIYRDKKTNRTKYYCEKCRLWFNDFAGTILEGTRLSLSQWFKAVYMFLKSNATAAGVASELKVNRNTAQALHKKINREKLWCQLLLNRFCGRTKNRAVVQFSLKEVAHYLDMSRRNLYRLVKKGSIKAVRSGGQWRVYPEEVQKYLAAKLTYYGISGRWAVREHHFFRPEVLDKYRKDPVEYYINEDVYQGWVGSNKDHHYVQKLLEIAGRKRWHAVGRMIYYNIHYFRMITPEGRPALAVSHRDYQEMPDEQYVHWSGFIISEGRKG